MDQWEVNWIKPKGQISASKKEGKFMATKITFFRSFSSTFGQKCLSFKRDIGLYQPIMDQKLIQKCFEHKT